MDDSNDGLGGITMTTWRDRRRARCRVGAEYCEMRLPTDVRAQQGVPCRMVELMFTDCQSSSITRVCCYGLLRQCVLASLRRLPPASAVSFPTTSFGSCVATSSSIVGHPLKSQTVVVL